MSAMSDYLESGLIGHLFRNISFTQPSEIWVGLVGGYNSGNLESGVFTDEISGGSYVRVSGGPGASYWKEPSSAGNGLTSNEQAFSFPTATDNWGYVSGVFIADGSGTLDNILFYGQLTTAKNVTNGDSFSFASGDLDIYFR